jgi:outer membrane protein OmpA-like peptidoglycan-associated protein
MFWDRSNAVDATYAERTSPTAFNQAGAEAEQRALSGWGPLNTPSAQGQTGPAANPQVRPAVAAPCRAAGPYFAYFNQDQYTVGPLHRAELDKLAAGRHPGHRITITGQNAGASSDTLVAARRRANEVAAYLEQRGVPRSTITVFASLEALGRVDGIHDREARRYMISAACG